MPNVALRPSEPASRFPASTCSRPCSGTGEGYWLQDRHLARLADSADYWGFPGESCELRKALEASAPAVQSRVRLLLAPDGGIGVESTPMPEIVPIRSLRVLPNSVNSRDPLLFHKTPARATYERAVAQRGDADDVLLVNERGEVTEASRANSAVLLNGEWLTPRLSCGLLPGTLRAELLANGDLREAVITLEQLSAAEAVEALNSVRGRSRVSLRY